MADGFITYFGYGSLVNRDTRPAGEQSYPARLYGWQRIWGHRVWPLGNTGNQLSCCSLTVKPASVPDTVDLSGPERDSAPFVDGVVVIIPMSDLPALDERERGYDRVTLPRSHFDLSSDIQAEEIQVYVSKVSNRGLADAEHPILQSYIDCVLAGYCAVFEQDGLQQFVDGTVGWQGVIENDRENPRYPRAVVLSAEQLQQFDQLVEKRRS